MADPLVLLETSGGVTQVTLNRPEKRNALSRELLVELLAVIRKVASDESSRLLVLQSAGPVFCAGMDLAQMQAASQSDNPAEVWQADSQLYRDVLVELFTLNVPTVVVVQGAAPAGGLGIVLACDIVLAAENALFSLPEPKRGITATIVTPLLTYRIGPGAASYLLLSGETFDAAAAFRIGLCHEVVSAAGLSNRVDELIGSILTGSPKALAKSKRDLLENAGAQVIPQLDAAVAGSAEARSTPDAREGLAAFWEKRLPSWQPE